MISCVILTKNEERNIKDCILSAKMVANEIIVVDDNSSDKTREIAKNLGAKVFIRDLKNDFSAQSNFAIKKAKSKWVLFLDADERISKNLAKEIISCVKTNNFNGFFLKRIDYVWGGWLTHGEQGAFKSLRLVKKNSGLWKRLVHQYFEIKGFSKTLKNPLLHYPHPTIERFIRKVNKWSSLHSLANKEEGKRSNIIKIIFFPIFHFLRNFVLRFGFLDGIRGFVFAVLMSFHSFLSWSKLWIIQKEDSKK